MKNGGIGRGWAPEESEDELVFLATGLLKSKIEEVWQKIRESHIKGQIRGVRGGRFGVYK